MRPRQGARSSGNERMETLVMLRVRRREPHRKVAGMVVNCMLSWVRRTSSSSSKSGSDIAKSFSMRVLVTVRLTDLTRLDCFNAATILSLSSRAGGSRFGTPPYFTMIGRAGQKSRAFRTGVP